MTKNGAALPEPSPSLRAAIQTAINATGRLGDEGVGPYYDVPTVADAVLRMTEADKSVAVAAARAEARLEAIDETAQSRVNDVDAAFENGVEDERARLRARIEALGPIPLFKIGSSARMCFLDDVLAVFDKEQG